MEQITDAMEMVDLMSLGAFCVKDGVIIKVNPLAAGRMIRQGDSIAPLLKTGADQYEAFRQGTLYLTLTLSGRDVGASVTRKKDFDLFILDHDLERSDLHALGLAARELRDPLSGLMVCTSQLLSAAQDAGPQTREQLGRMNRNLYQLLRLVGNMSDAGRYSDAGTGNFELLDLRAIVADAAAKAAALAEHAGIRLEQELHPEPIYTLMDEEKLERALLNLLSNAMKFTPGGQSVLVRLVRRDNTVQLSVRDTGCGIPDSLRSGIFSRYNREPGLEDSRFGIGLGLVLVRSAAMLHGGTVLVDHPEGIGTRVTITLPIRPGTGKELRSPILKVDYAGELDHSLIEFSELLPSELYGPEK